jgi:hypothetical protein
LLSWGVPEFEMFFSFYFLVAFQLPGKGAGGRSEDTKDNNRENTEGR